MRFFASASAALAFAASALAQTADFDPIFTPKEGAEIPAGSTFEITWEAPPKYKDGTVSISLIGGADQGTLVPIADIAGGIANSAESYQWAVDATLGAENTYGLVFKLESNTDIFQYSFPFKITEGKGEEPEKSDEPSKPTHVVTTAHGIKTITLTSCPPESTSTPPPPPPPVTSTWIAPNTTSTWATSTSTKQWNTTTVINTPLPPPATTVINTPAPEPTVPSTIPTPVPTAAGAQLIAGPVAVIAGLAVALAL